MKMTNRLLRPLFSSIGMSSFYATHVERSLTSCEMMTITKMIWEKYSGKKPIYTTSPLHNWRVLSLVSRCKILGSGQQIICSFRLETMVGMALNQSLWPNLSLLNLPLNVICKSSFLDLIHSFRTASLLFSPH